LLGSIFRVAKFFLAGVALVVAVLLSYAFLMPRPLDTTDKSIFEGNGRDVDYCALPVLDGSGKSANAIPKAYTPGCALEDVPLPILAECTEPLVPGVVDMRGLWRGISGRVGHLERIEQCGNRVVVTAHGIIHDFRLDGTLKNGARDVGALCNNFHTAIHVNEEGVMVFRLFDWFDTVTRKMDGENMIFTFIDGTSTRTERICEYPQNAALGGFGN
tara:strand:- start:126 stop:773 length:648 start_codon:yes stop_codon:yes gene_type:complete